MSDFIHKLLCPSCERNAVTETAAELSDKLGDVFPCPHCGLSLMYSCDMDEDSFWYDLETVEDADNP